MRCRDVKHWSQTRLGFGQACVGGTRRNWEGTSILLHRTVVEPLQLDFGQGFST